SGGGLQCNVEDAIGRKPAGRGVDAAVGAGERLRVEVAPVGEEGIVKAGGRQTGGAATVAVGNKANYAIRPQDGAVERLPVQRVSEGQANGGSAIVAARACDQ